ncbi:hypothetical protein ACF09Y_30365 [Streptomyces massasporeus]|uniref:hypothetical protein n=1 Tax=Streptomyces massasporeus TaxID=67324 RepID=UPI0036FD6D7D
MLSSTLAVVGRTVTWATSRAACAQGVPSSPTGRQARRAILAAGSRACHSVPLTTESGLCVGMVSAHVDRTLGALTTTQTQTLDTVGCQAGRWLAWHDRTVVLDALEYLHTLGRAGRGSSFRRT